MWTVCWWQALFGLAIVQALGGYPCGQCRSGGWALSSHVTPSSHFPEPSNQNGIPPPSCDFYPSILFSFLHSVYRPLLVLLLLYVYFCFVSLFKKIFKCLFIFWEREQESDHMHKSGRGRVRETQNPKQAPGSELPDVGLELTNREIRTWAEVGCLNNWATHVPQQYIF